VAALQPLNSVAFCLRDATTTRIAADSTQAQSSINEHNDIKGMRLKKYSCSRMAENQNGGSFFVVRGLFSTVCAVRCGAVTYVSRLDAAKHNHGRENGGVPD
jgi:hypothetical protein